MPTASTQPETSVDPELVAALEGVPLFAQLTPQQLRRVASLARVKRYSAGTTIVKLGGRGDAFYVILEGRALVVRKSGRPLPLSPGDFFGELALIERAPRSADVLAGEDVLALVIDHAAFTRLIRTEAALTYEIVTTLVARLRADQRSSAGELGNLPALRR